MGVYIKGQEMPETCNDCDFLDLDTFDYEMHTACGFTGEIVTYDLRHGRNENCPLIEVTEPHGRLIYADDVVEHAAVNGEDGEFIRKLADYIDDADAIIEAEGK